MLLLLPAKHRAVNTSKASSLRSTLVFFQPGRVLQENLLVPMFCFYLGLLPSPQVAMLTLAFSVYLRFLWLPGVSTGEDGGGAQQFFIQISA